jgi:hypothetical protein
MDTKQDMQATGAARNSPPGARHVRCLRFLCALHAGVCSHPKPVPIPSPCCQVDQVLRIETRNELFKKHVRNGWGRHWQMQEKRVKNRSIDSGNKQAVLMSSSTFGIPRSNVTATSTVSRFAACGRSGGIGLLNPTKCRLEWPSIHGCQGPRSRYHRRRLTLLLLEQLNQHVGNVRSWS